MIGDLNNYDNIFFRMVNTALCKTLTRSIRWINRFEDKKIRVVVPFYMSMVGSERYLFDAFVDDISDKRVELNTDQVPRGIITLTSFASNADEFANPNEYLSKKSMINGQFRKIISKVRAIPITMNYDIEIRVDSEIDAYKCSEKILNMLFNYMFFNIDYYGIKIDAIMSLPDDKEVTLPREITLDSDNKKFVKFSLSVKSYYPVFYSEKTTNACFGGFQPVDDDDLEICDNDGDFDWDRMEVTNPTDLQNCLLDNGLDYNAIKAVYWRYFINRDDELFGTLSGGTFIDRK